jgi:molecular chaperone DnaJ
MRDHYQVLQVDRRAEREVIEKAYRALSLKYHPDVVSPARRDAATRKMQRINAAYAVLGDASARKRYDETLGSHPGVSAWDTFMDKGLVGMFLEQMRPPRS